MSSLIFESKLENESNINNEELQLMNRYWDALNYLTVGQIYLQDNPLMREPLKDSHVKPRLLGHFGTSPGLNFLYTHLNRLIRKNNLDNVLCLIGPGHGGPAFVGATYLEGTYTELFPQITQDTPGLKRLFRQFSTPKGKFRYIYYLTETS